MLDAHLLPSEDVVRSPVPGPPPCPGAQWDEVRECWECWDEVDGKWLLSMIEHYVEHGRYWRDNIFKARDDMFENLARGDYVWLRA